MKIKMRRILELVLVCVFIMSNSISAMAYEPLKINFKEFSFTTNDYIDQNVHVVYTADDKQENALIYDALTGTLLEKISVQKANTRAVGPYIFKRSKSYGATTLELSVNVSLYTEGSFRQINSVQGSYLGITTAVTSTSIEDSNVNVWSENNVFPTTQLSYAYNCTLIATVTSDTTGMFDARICAELVEAGFTGGTVTGTAKHYRRAADSTGTIRVY